MRLLPVISRKSAISMVALLCAGVSLQEARAGFPYSDRYEAWIHAHPFPLGSWYTGENPFPALTTAQQVNRYQAAGYTRMPVFLTPTAQTDVTQGASVGLEWALIATTPATYQATVNLGMTIAGGPSAIIVGDEPIDSQIAEVADRIHWVQQNYQVGVTDAPLVFANLSALSINIDNYVTQAHPDVLSYDRYPLLLNGATVPSYFSEMNLVRSKSLQHKIPMWMIQQGFSRPWTGDGEQYRLPSESDLRFQAFSFLAHGGQGIDHFIYLTESFPQAVITHAGNQASSAYAAIQNMSPEILKLGSSLPLLKPVNNVEFIGNALSEFNGVTPFVSTSSRKLYNISGAQSALVSYFQDQQGSDYFMLVNLLHGANLNKQQTEDAMVLYFDPAVTYVERLNRLTGQVEVLNTIANPGGGNRYLSLTLEGGTGDLFKYPSATSFALIATTGTWAIDGSGDWNSPSNWNDLVPNDSTATARFGSAITANRSIYTDIATTVGGLRFDNANRYVIGGAGTLSVESSSGTALVEVLQGSHKINLPLIFVSNANVSVSGGATLTLADPVLIKANKTVTRVGTGSLLIQAPLTLESGGTLAVGAGPLTLSGAASLAGGSRINVGTQSVNFDHSGRGSPASVIEAQLTSGHNGGSWNGEGIMTSAGDATKGLGWVDEGSNKNVKVKFTYYGDSNLSGTVDSIDFTAFLAGYGLTSGGVWANGDYNYDDKVNTQDFNHLAGNFGMAAIPSTTLGSVVPEPGTCVLMIFVASCFTRCRAGANQKLWRSE